MKIKKDSGIELNSEDHIILYCNSNNINPKLKEKISLLCDSELNWEYIINFATRHRLRTLLYYNLNSICPEKVPEDILNKLKTFYQNNVHKNLLLTGELVKVMELLENNGIHAVAYKGPVLALQAYKNIGLREFGDIDLFIDKSDALNIKQVMINHGYDLYPALNFKNDNYYLKFITEHSFINKNNGTIIEIKWRFEGDFISFPTNHYFTSNKSYKQEINGFKLNTFSPESQIQVLCVHSAKHDWKKLSWICDIAEFIKREDINWEEIIASSKKLGIERMIIVNLILARDLFHLNIPEEIKNEINKDSTATKIAHNIKKQIFIEQKGSLNLFEKFFLDFKKRESVFYGIKDCFNSFTKPGYKDFNDFPLPEVLFPLYHVIRPFLLLKRYGNKPL
jgi:hypothetical protein